MDEKEKQKLLRWYDECESDTAPSEHDPYSTDEDSDFEVNSSELEESSSDSESENTSLGDQNKRKYALILM